MVGEPHIVLNALLMNPAPTYRGAGISAYEQNLLTALATVGKDMAFTAVVAAPEWQAPGSLQVYRAPKRAQQPVFRILWEQVRLPLVIRRLGTHLFHALAFVVPLWGLVIPQVITVHDLSFVRFPETLPPWKARYLRWFTRLSLKRAARIIAVSESTRRDVLAWLSLPPERVVTVHNGVEARFRPLSPTMVEEWRLRKGLPRRFVLYLGTLQPRKNVETLVRAFAEWRRQALPSMRDVVLVLAGAKGWFYSRLFRLVDELDMREHVMFPGYLPAEELPLWYNAAMLFAYPSLFEGFGLPVLEAMACGTAVVAANTSSLPEIVGNAGVLLPPTDVGAWARILEDLLSNEERRVMLGQAGRERAQQFTWERTARETVAVYQEALSAFNE